jgi:hypothetical protein
MHSGMSPISSTYKYRDVEETLDIYFYRPLGYGVAHVASILKMTPNAITFMSMLTGIASGMFFYFPILKLTVIGIMLFVLSDVLDSADGQLARLTGVKTELGRFFDGISGTIIFIIIHLSICFRIIAGGGSAWIFLLALAAGVSGSIQCALADYYRNAFIFFARGPQFAELGDLDLVKTNYEKLSWLQNFGKKLAMRIYLTYTREQELMSSNFVRLKTIILNSSENEISQGVRSQYLEKSRPQVKYCNILTTNTRAIALFIFLLLKIPQMFFLFEIIVLNMVLIYVLLRQNLISADLLGRLENSAGN